MPTLNLLFIESFLGGMGVGIFSIGFIAFFIRKIFKFGIILMLLANIFWAGAIAFPAKISIFLLENGLNDNFLNQDVRYFGVVFGLVISFIILFLVFFLNKKKAINAKSNQEKYPKKENEAKEE